MFTAPRGLSVVAACVREQPGFKGVGLGGRCVYKSVLVLQRRGGSRTGRMPSTVQQVSKTPNFDGSVTKFGSEVDRVKAI